MSYSAFILIILLSASGAALVSYAVHRGVHIDTRRRHHDVGSAVFLQLGVLLAVLVAFVFNEAYSEYGQAEQAIDLECGALHAAAMIESALPPPQAHELLTLQAAYIQAVIRYDWPEMRAHHRGSPIAVTALTSWMQQTARLPVATPADMPVKTQLLDLLTTAHAQREVRLFQAQNGLPAVLWAVLAIFSAFLVVFVAFSGVEQCIWLITFAVTFAASLGAILGLVGLLNYPFQGALALSPDDFQARLANATALLAAPEQP